MYVYEPDQISRNESNDFISSSRRRRKIRADNDMKNKKENIMNRDKDKEYCRIIRDMFERSNHRSKAWYMDKQGCNKQDTDAPRLYDMWGYSEKDQIYYNSEPIGGFDVDLYEIIETYNGYSAELGEKIKKISHRKAWVTDETAVRFCTVEKRMALYCFKRVDNLGVARMPVGAIEAVLDDAGKWTRMQYALSTWSIPHSRKFWNSTRKQTIDLQPLQDFVRTKLWPILTIDVLEKFCLVCDTVLPCSSTERDLLRRKEMQLVESAEAGDVCPNWESIWKNDNIQQKCKLSINAHRTYMFCILGILWGRMYREETLCEASYPYAHFKHIFAPYFETDLISAKNMIGFREHWEFVYDFVMNCCGISVESAVRFFRAIYCMHTPNDVAERYFEENVVKKMGITLWDQAESLYINEEWEDIKLRQRTWRILIGHTASEEEKKCERNVLSFPVLLDIAHLTGAADQEIGSYYFMDIILGKNPMKEAIDNYVSEIGIDSNEVFDRPNIFYRGNDPVKRRYVESCYIVPFNRKLLDPQNHYHPEFFEAVEKNGESIYIFPDVDVWGPFQETARRLTNNRGICFQKTILPFITAYAAGHGSATGWCKTPEIKERALVHQLMEAQLECDIMHGHPTLTKIYGERNWNEFEPCPIVFDAKANKRNRNEYDDDIRMPFAVQAYGFPEPKYFYMNKRQTRYLELLILKIFVFEVITSGTAPTGGDIRDRAIALILPSDSTTGMWKEPQHRIIQGTSTRYGRCFCDDLSHRNPLENIAAVYRDHIALMRVRRTSNILAGRAAYEYYKLTNSIFEKTLGKEYAESRLFQHLIHIRHIIDKVPLKDIATELEQITMYLYGPTLGSVMRRLMGV